MADTVSDSIIERLQEWGVYRIYGYPGDGINGLMAALHKAGNMPRFIQTRHEEMAAFMACAHAKFTGEVGVCMATSGPGAIHLLNGFYDAKMDHQPVVAIMGQSATAVLSGDFQQEVDLPSLFKDVAKEYLTTISSPKAARHAIDRAIRIAMDQRTVTCVIIPKDVQEEDAVRQPPHVHDSVHSGIGYRPTECQSEAGGGRGPSGRRKHGHVSSLHRGIADLALQRQVPLLATAG